jgi:hypothetical protein
MRQAGLITEDAHSLHRRTGLLSERKITSALVSLIASGRIIKRDDGRLDSPTTHDELSWQDVRRKGQSEAGKASAAKRAEKDKEKQQTRPTGVDAGVQPLRRRERYKC